MTYFIRKISKFRDRIFRALVPVKVYSVRICPVGINQGGLEFQVAERSRNRAISRVRDHLTRGIGIDFDVKKLK